LNAINLASSYDDAEKSNRNKLNLWGTVIPNVNNNNFTTS